MCDDAGIPYQKSRNRRLLRVVIARDQEDRLSFVGQGPLDAIMRCLRGGRAAQQQCALDALTTVRALVAV